MTDNGWSRLKARIYGSRTRPRWVDEVTRRRQGEPVRYEREVMRLSTSEPPWMVMTEGPVVQTAGPAPREQKPCTLCQGYCTNGAECAIGQMTGDRIDWRQDPIVILGRRE